MERQTSADILGFLEAQGGSLDDLLGGGDGAEAALEGSLPNGGLGKLISMRSLEPPVATGLSREMSLSLFLNQFKRGDGMSLGLPDLPNLLSAGERAPPVDDDDPGIPYAADYRPAKTGTEEPNLAAAAAAAAVAAARTAPVAAAALPPPEAPATARGGRGRRGASNNGEAAPAATASTPDATPRGTKRGRQAPEAAAAATPAAPLPPAEPAGSLLDEDPLSHGGGSSGSDDDDDGEDGDDGSGAAAAKKPAANRRGGRRSRKRKEPMSADDRAMKRLMRMEKNRESAARSRARKQEQMEVLEKKVAELSRENDKLAQELKEKDDGPKPPVVPVPVPVPVPERPEDKLLTRGLRKTRTLPTGL